MQSKYVFKLLGSYGSGQMNMYFIDSRSLLAPCGSRGVKCWLLSTYPKYNGSDGLVSFMIH